ncbi:MAG: TonB-dependent receptor [Acidobacteriota bacterium]|nr:TonB-dependent receptor [Acidobacteriota bacterium]MDE3265609.1 TonB-dependent receptor [Acidobacteriota bacterium]
MCLRSTLAAVLLAAAAAPATAQSEATTGIIRGTVRGPDGATVGGAHVLIQHAETGFTTSVETTATGTFARTLLPLGSYELIVTKDEAGLMERLAGLTLRVGESLNLDIALKEVVAEEITVSTDAYGTAATEDVTTSQRLSDEVIEGLPVNGRNFFDLTLLTPGASLSQGPDGDELNISGQRGIFNNFIVDGADFNNSFFGEQRGGQRPAFTFNQDAIQEMVVINQGATAEFGRSAGGFVNVITKSGTNEFEGTVHTFRQWDGISTEHPSGEAARPDFSRLQYGFTLGGPIRRERVFFFGAYDEQDGTETKQAIREVVNPYHLARLDGFLRNRWPGLFDDEFGPIERSDDNRALIAKLDFNLSESHQASVKYNYTWSEQENGTFDVDSWGLSANGIEQDYSHAVNLSLRSLLSNRTSNELRLQWAREHRPRRYGGPLQPGVEPPPQPPYMALGGRPFPDIAMDFADGFRIGLPFFLPIGADAADDRKQLVDNVSTLLGDHLVKAGIEANRTGIAQQFLGFGNSRYIFDSVDGFINFMEQGNHYVTCSDGTSSAAGHCPPGTGITGPVLLYLQAATVPGIPPEDLGKQAFDVDEVGLFLQDTWQASERIVLNLGVRWEGTWNPDPLIAPRDTWFAPYLDDPRFPSDGTIPDDLDNFQPRLGLVWDASGDGSNVLRLNAGSYVSRIPSLVLAGPRTTNGAFQQVLFRSSAASPALGPVPPIDQQIDGSDTVPFLPDITVVDRDLELPETWSFGAGFERRLGRGVTAELSYQHARTDELFRFVDRNHPGFGAPFGIGTHPGGGGINVLNNTESSARSRYHGLTATLRGRGAFDGLLTFEVNYTLSRDRSDDDNERDPFTFRYADPTNLGPEFGWSDRDRRHQVAGYLLFALPGEVQLSNVFRYLSASPVSESCNAPGRRAAQPSDRVCADGGVLQRNTLRRDNDFLTWDVRLSRPFTLGRGITLEPVFEIFNLTNADNRLDASQGSLLFNFDGTIRSGLGDSRRGQVGLHLHF